MISETLVLSTARHGFASAVIVERKTSRVICETFNQRVIDALNTARYKAVPIGEYLGNLNKSIRENGGVQP